MKVSHLLYELAPNRTAVICFNSAMHDILNVACLLFNDNLPVTFLLACTFVMHLHMETSCLHMTMVENLTMEKSVLIHVLLKVEPYSWLFLWARCKFSLFS